MNLLTNTRSPIATVSSMDPVGTSKEARTKLLMTSTTHSSSSSSLRKATKAGPFPVDPPGLRTELRFADMAPLRSDDDCRPADTATGFPQPPVQHTMKRHEPGKIARIPGKAIQIMIFLNRCRRVADGNEWLLPGADPTHRGGCRPGSRLVAGRGPKLVEIRRRNRYGYGNGSQKGFGFAAALRLIPVAP